MDQISIEVGSGGKLMQDFIKTYILTNYGNPFLNSLSDAAHLPSKIAFTTDSYVIDPIFFPGGDIGSLCVNGTVNDLIVSGAKPQYLSLSFILEEGMRLESFKKILLSIQEAARFAKVLIVTGDTKVVKRGQADKIFINTAGVGTIVSTPSLSSIQQGDKIIVTGSLGEHTLAVIQARGDFSMETEAKSDCAPLTFLLPFWKMEVKWMRDVTRGGLATILSELAEKLPYAIVIEEEKLPLSLPVRSASELLGIDPLYMACEGRAVLVVSANKAEKILEKIKKNPLGKQAEIIGQIDEKRGKAGELLLATSSGGLRLLEPLTSELLPRIC